MIHSSIALQVIPTTADGDEKELLRIVDAVIAYIHASALTYVVGPFETTVEGPFDQLMDIVKRSQEICIEEGAERVSSYVKIVHAPGQKILSIDDKIGKYSG